MHESYQKQLENEKRIAIILGLLEETHRGKNWILRKIHDIGLTLQVNPEMNGYEILNCCPPEFVKALLNSLKGNDITVQDGIQTRTYHWFFTDIIAGANPLISTEGQVKKILVLNDLISKTSVFRERDLSSTIILSTGDGMAIGFGDSPEKTVLLSIQLHRFILQYNKSKRGKDKILLRIGLESGPIYFTKDIEGKDTVWGPGLLVARRVMDLCGEMQILAATRITEDLINCSPKYKEMLHFVETLETEHGEKIQIFNIYGEGFGTKSVTKENKVTTDIQRKVKPLGNFSFNEIDVRLDVLNAKTMLTHHTWMWDIVNKTREEKSQIFYYLDGQVKKDFSELDVKVTDDSNKRLDISNLSVNRPYRKEFYVSLNKPLMPKQRLRLKLQYDWEEPEREFVYRFPSALKKFSYTCTLPHEIDVKNRILKVDIDTGYKVHASPPASVKRQGSKIVISWEKSNIFPQDAYKFQW